MRSLELAFPDAAYRLLYDNQSTDGSREQESMLCGTDWHFACGVAGRSTPGAGANGIVRQIQWANVGYHDVVVVMSDDDMVWKPGVQEMVERAWAGMPDDLVLVSGLLEPMWSWNEPRETVDCGGVRVLVRDSVPAAGWMFRLRHWPLFGPVKDDDFGEDYDACCRLRQAGYRVAGIDLATHAGGRSSTHGNRAADSPLTRPLDRERWGV